MGLESSNALLNMILSLLSDQGAAKDFFAAPQQALANAGLEGVCGADVDAVLPLVLDSAPVTANANTTGPYNTEGNDVSPSSGAAPGPSGSSSFGSSGASAHASEAVAADYTNSSSGAQNIAYYDSHAVVETITQVLNNFSYNTVNQTITAAGNVDQQFGDYSLLAAGAGAVPAESVIDATTASSGLSGAGSPGASAPAAEAIADYSNSSSGVQNIAHYDSHAVVETITQVRNTVSYSTVNQTITAAGNVDQQFGDHSLVAAGAGAGPAPSVIDKTIASGNGGPDGPGNAVGHGKIVAGGHDNAVGNASIRNSAVADGTSAPNHDPIIGHGNSTENVVDGHHKVGNSDNHIDDHNVIGNDNLDAKNDHYVGNDNLDADISDSFNDHPHGPASDLSDDSDNSDNSLDLDHSPNHHFSDNFAHDVAEIAPH